MTRSWVCARRLSLSLTRMVRLLRQPGCFGPEQHNSTTAATQLHPVHTGSGTIDAKEMKTALQSMGHTPSDEELFAIVHEVGASSWDRAPGTTAGVLRSLTLCCTHVIGG